MTIKELLEAAGVTITPEQETKINAEFPKSFKPADVYNADVKKHKDSADAYKAQLDEANKAIEGFKAMDIDGIKAASEKYKADFEKAEADHKAQLEKMAYDSAADKFIDTLNPKDGLSKKAILGEFATKQFKLEDDSFVGGKEWAEQFKKDNAAHFSDGKQPPNIISGKFGEPGQEVNLDVLTASMRKAAGLPDTTPKL